MELALLVLIHASTYALIAVGFALVFGSCRVLNLTHGFYVMLGAYATHFFAAGLAGLGVAQMPVFVACPYLRSGQFELLLDDWWVDPLPLHVVYPQNRHLSAKVRAFVEWVAELFADHPALRLPERGCGFPAEPPTIARRTKKKAAAAL